MGRGGAEWGGVGLGWLVVTRAGRAAAGRLPQRLGDAALAVSAAAVGAPCSLGLRTQRLQLPARTVVCPTPRLLCSHPTYPSLRKSNQPCRCLLLPAAAVAPVAAAARDAQLPEFKIAEGRGITLDRPLGSGHFGRVYRGRQKATGQGSAGGEGAGRAGCCCRCVLGAAVTWLSQRRVCAALPVGWVFHPLRRPPPPNHGLLSFPSYPYQYSRFHHSSPPIT